MLLALDVGNSNTVMGLFKTAADGSPAEMVADWRITTPSRQTPDELGVLFGTLFAMRRLEPGVVDGVAVSSVVPPLDATLRRLCETYFKVRPLFVEPGVKTAGSRVIDFVAPSNCSPGPLATKHSRGLMVTGS